MTWQQLGGGALVLLFLADISLTVLYARAGTGLLAPHWNRLVWRTIDLLSRPLGRRRDAVLSAAGPLIVVSLIGFWSIGLTSATALILQPELGRAIRPSSGTASSDAVTALLVAGNSLSIVGGGDYSPHSTGTRLLFLLNSLIGASVLTLVLSYLVQVYSALRERNALALAIDLMTDGTGDAAVLLARLTPGGNAGNATGELGNLVAPLAETKEAHHFYPLLLYFRFTEPVYAVSRFGLVLLDATTLIATALDRDRYRALAASAPVAAIGRGARILLQTVDGNLPTSGGRGDEAADDWRLRQSYRAAVRTLARGGIAVRADGIDDYVAARRAWEPLVRRIAPALGYTVAQIDGRSPAAPSDVAD